MSIPKTANLPLSDDRKKKFISEASETFTRNCIARDMLRVVRPRSATGFRQIGINHIVDRIWFVETTFPEGYFATPSGAEYGSAIAEREAELVLRGLVEHTTDEYILRIAEDPNETDAETLLSEMRNKGFNPGLILTNLDQVFRFWEFKGFVPGGLRRGLRSPEGYFDGVPILHSRLLPGGLTLAIDSGELGVLEVKTDFVASVIDVQALPPNELEAVRKALPSLDEQELKEKVRILCYELIKPSIAGIDKMGFHIMLTEGTSMEIGPPKPK
jgi:hypothetical protein